MSSTARSSSALSRIKATMRRVPAVDALVTARQHRHFLSHAGLTSHWGVYETFDEARRALPPSHGFDTVDVVEDVRRRGLKLHPHDYPVLYWLERAFALGASGVYDIGGSVGSHFYAYRRVLPYPDGLDWVVCELPAAVETGSRMAEATGAAAEGLRFVATPDTHEIAADVWISAGALQYLEDAELGPRLESARRAPRHIVLNKLPLYGGDDFVVTQNVGPDCYSPAWVWNRDRFIERVRDCGYRLVDEWDVPGRDLYLPQHPQRSFRSFTGLCFERESLNAMNHSRSESLAHRVFHPLNLAGGAAT
jgi:putative methyltransferase (TIGR04325 family)